MKIDLHMHSTASDGTDKPEEIVRQCAEQGLEYAVLTDHDTIAGVAAFATEAQKQGIKTVSGIEFSANSEKEMHILIYGADLQNAEFCALMTELAKRRSSRIAEMTQKLIDLGFGITHEQVWRFGGKRLCPGRPHIALALVEAGEAASVDEAFRKYLKVGLPGICTAPWCELGTNFIRRAGSWRSAGAGSPEVHLCCGF